MVNIKISRFSRAKKTVEVADLRQEPEPEIKPQPVIEPIIEPQPVIEPILESQPIIIEPPLPLIDDAFDDLNSFNFKPDEPPVKATKVVKTKDKPFDLTKIINQHK